MSDGDISTRLRAALAGLNEIDTLPERPFMRTYRVRLVSQKADGRVALQQVDRGEASSGPDLPDPLPLPVWMGLPGASAQYTPGQEMLLAFAGAKGNEPIVFAAAPQGFPSAIPISVTLEATTELRLFDSSAGVLRIGPALPTPPAAVAIAARVQTAFDALGTLAAAIGTFGTATGGAVPALVGPAGTLAAAVAAASGALAALATPYPAGYYATRTETL